MECIIKFSKGKSKVIALKSNFVSKQGDILSLHYRAIDKIESKISYEVQFNKSELLRLIKLCNEWIAVCIFCIQGFES